MRIAVMGTGGVGGYFGGMLARAGHDVTFIARGAHLAAIREHGLRIQTVHGDFTIRAPATDDPGEVGPVELVLFCVKTYHTEEAGHAMAPLVGDKTLILSLQNGVDNEEKLAAMYGREHVLGGVCYIASTITSPGVVTQVSGPRSIVFGELDGSITARAQRVHQVLVEAGIDTTLSDNIHKALWTKFLFICALSGVGSVARATVGEMVAIPETRELLRETMAEVEAVARARGVELEAGIVDQMMRTAEGFAPESKPSMLVDVERGNRLEIDALNGTVARLGAMLGVPTPANRFIYAALKPADERAKRA
ncbi:MAG: 2-dehydropantoate 2-reductase [Chloroflexi bacterium]|nr:MAG: 2-dehydropantoate 2-reductase [Chloroflexota bacterium]